MLREESKLTIAKFCSHLRLILALSLCAISIASSAFPAQADVGREAIAKIAKSNIPGMTRKHIRNMTESYEFVERKFGSNHPMMAKFLSRLGRVFVELTRYQDAAPLLEKSLEIEEQYYGVSHPEVAATLHNLAEVYRLRGNYHQAEPLLKRDLSINENSPNAKPTDVPQSLSTLARLYKQMGRYDEAEQLYKRSIAITEKRLGTNHPEIARTSTDFAQFYLEWKRFPKSETQYKRALSIYKRGKGADHPYTLIALSNLAVFYQKSGQQKNAVELYQQILKVYDQKIGRNHINAATPNANLAAIYQDQRKFKKAEEHFRRSLTIVKTALGPNHLELGNVYSDLGGLYIAKEEPKKAAQFYRQALDIFDKNLGSDHASTGNICLRLGDAYRAMKQNNNALKYYVQSQKNYEQAFGPYHPKVAEALEKQLALYESMDRKPEIERLQKRMAIMPKAGTRNVSFYFATNRVSENGSYTQALAETNSFGEVVMNVPSDEVKKRAERVGESLGQLEKAKSGKLTDAETLKIVRTRQLPTPKQFSSSIRASQSHSTIFKNQAIVFVHGFNNDFEGTMKRTTQLSFDLQFDGIAIPFTWPSQGSVTAYLSDVDMANKSIEPLVAFLDQLRDTLPEVKIHLLAHSLGNQVMLQALCKIAKRSNATRHNFGQVISAHADVSPEEFEKLTSCFDQQVEGITLYVNEEDTALRLRCAGLFKCRAGNKARGYSKADVIDTTQMSGGFFRTLSKGFDHDIFVRNPILFSDIARLILTGKRPVDRRTQEFRPKKDDKGHTFWTYDKSFDPVAKRN